MELIVPNILQCNRYIAKASEEHRRLVKDFEFDYYVGGERDILLDGNPYKATSGTVVFRRPNQMTVGKGDYNCFILSVDFEKKMKTAPHRYIRHRQSQAQNPDAAPFLDELPPVFIPHCQNDLRALYEKLTECSYPHVVDPQRQSEYMEELLLLLLWEAKRYRRQKQERKEDYIRELCSYINQNYMHRLSLEKLAAQVSLNKNYMIRLFKQQMNTTPVAYIREIRLFYARTILIDSSLSVNEIAISCGFRSAAYFSKEFREKYGAPPTEYRKAYVGTPH